MNKDQKMRLSIALRVVEENMQDVEQILNSGSYMGILYDSKCDLPSEMKKEILKSVSLIRDRLKVLSSKFDLEKEYRNATKKIFNKFFSSWETLEGVKAKRLKGYGAVSDELYNILDPQLNMGIDLILEIQRLI